MIRKAEINDAEALAPLVKKLWPEHSTEALCQILAEYAAGPDSCAFIYEEEGRKLGTALCGLRNDYVEGCETSPVGYLEGIYVEEGRRLGGIARALVKACEKWAVEKGCREFASDCRLGNEESLRFHLASGFSEVNRIICFRKDLT